MKWNSQEFFERKIASKSKYVVFFKKILLEKVAFMNSSCFVICEPNWIVFMAIAKHFRFKMRLAFFCSVNLIEYTMPRDFHSQNYLSNLLFAKNKLLE